jgi:hypothetical protein
MPEALEQTARAADRARGELLATVKELDRRRRLALDLKYQARKHVSLVLVVAAVSIVGIGAATVVTTTRRRNRKAPTHRERVRGLVRVWNHPQRIAIAGSRPLRLATKIAAAVVIEQLAKFAFEKLRSARRSRERLRERGNGRVPAHLPTEHLESV